MTQQQLALNSISDTFGGAASMDQILGGIAFAVLLIGFLAYSIYDHKTRKHDSPFNGLH